MYEHYTKLGSLTEYPVFAFLYKEAVKHTASSYSFAPVIHETSLMSAYHRFNKLFVPLTEHEYTHDKVVTLAVALCIQATAAFPIIWYGGSNNTDNVRSQFDGIPVRYATELVALSFGVLIFSVESSRILRAQGYHSSNYVELEFLDLATIRKAVKFIQNTRAAPANRPDYTQSFRHLMRIFKLVLDYKIGSGRIAGKGD